MKTILKTQRLTLRELNIEDAIHFFEINNDPEVIKYTGDRAFKSLAEARNFLINYNKYNLYEMGRWAVIDTKSNAFLGWCGLKFHAKEKIVDVGFRFYKKYWNQGFATESAKACIEYGFKTLKLTHIFAHAHIENLTSHRVLKKCGLQYLKTFDYDGMPANLYTINNPYLSITQIASRATYAVRHPVLRAGRPIEDCRFDHDDDITTFHLGLYVDNNLLGVVTFIKNDYKNLQGNQYQLRGMAILKDYQKRGFGTLLVVKGEAIIKQKQGDLVWCNAREIAVDFYKRNGFSIIGDAFTIPKIGLHYTMFKKL